MKKTLCIMLAVTLCLAMLLVGCAQEPKTQGEFCRVLCLMDDGIVVWIADIGHVYVKHVDAALGIKPLSTVVMDFAQSDLKAAEGAFTDAFGEELTYSYILETPRSIRLADSAAGEPTFG